MKQNHILLLETKLVVKLGNIRNTCECLQQMFLATCFLILPWLKTNQDGSESKVLLFVCLFLQENSIGLFFVQLFEKCALSS